MTKKQSKTEIKIVSVNVYVEKRESTIHYTLKGGLSGSIQVSSDNPLKESVPDIIRQAFQSLRDVSEADLENALEA